MKDNCATMTENTTMAPPPFKLERELTLMPSEFQERLSASNKSRRSSAARSAAKHRARRRNAKSGKHATNEYSNLNYFQQDSNFQEDFEQHGERMPPHINNSPNSSFNCGYNDNHSVELNSTSSHIELNEDVKFMLDNAYANYETETEFSVKTPPTNMHIGDLMIPLDDWRSHESIREKKYTVLPSISRSSDRSEYSEKRRAMTRHSNKSADLMVNNQLDFTRDKIEQEADFFADFRVNTSNVKPTPRQNPLPPIKHDPRQPITIPSASVSRQNSEINTKMKLQNKGKSTMYS